MGGAPLAHSLSSAAPDGTQPRHPGTAPSSGFAALPDPLPSPDRLGAMSYPLPGARRSAVSATEFLARSCRSARARGELGSGAIATPRPPPSSRKSPETNVTLADLPGGCCEEPVSRPRPRASRSSLKLDRQKLWPRPNSRRLPCGLHLLTQSPFGNKRDKRETQISLKMLRHGQPEE